MPRERKTDIAGDYPVALELEYKVISAETAETGTGRTEKMSSRQITFVVDRRFEIGTSVEISVAWPVLLDDRVKLQLFLEGYVVRSDGHKVTARFSKYYFRTRKTRAALAQVAQWPIGAGKTGAITEDRQVRVSAYA